MFRYLAHGQRDYADSSAPIRRRPTWEFEAVLEGRIAPVLASGPQVALERTLWAFPPYVEHEWTGERGRPAEVVVFHPLQVPPLLAQVARAAEEDGRILSISLTDGDIAWLRRTCEAARQAINHPDSFARLELERIILDLALRVLRGVPARWLPAVRPDPTALVVRVLAWLEDHLADGAGIADACTACGCSPAHLRRMFHAVRGTSPRQALCDLRLRRADHLLAEPSRGLADIARLSGFADAASLCRTYRAQRGTSPRRLHGSGSPPRRS